MTWDNSVGIISGLRIKQPRDRGSIAGKAKSFFPPPKPPGRLRRHSSFQFYGYRQLFPWGEGGDGKEGRSVSWPLTPK
jgi:hypothetical protein